MTSNQHGPYVRGDTRVTMAATEGSYPARGCGSRKAVPVRTGVCNPTPRSWIRESSRISHGAVNTFPGLVHTARQAMEAAGA